MPYKVARRGEKWAVVNPVTGKVYGEHPSEKEADAQLHALYANAPLEDEKKKWADALQVLRHDASETTGR
jgi:predicted protein tyrosine phosphatase